MKKFMLTAAFFTGLLLAGNVKAQTTPVNSESSGAIIKFETDTIKYGSIAYGSDGYRYFKFSNVGTGPLIITEAHGSCGCTIPTPPKEPILQGQSSEMKVHYDTQRPGHFIKSVTVTTNGTPSSKVVYITGDVGPKPVEATPPAQAPTPGVAPANK